MKRISTRTIETAREAARVISEHVEHCPALTIKESGELSAALCKLQNFIALVEWEEENS